MRSKMLPPDSESLCGEIGLLISLGEDGVGALSNVPRLDTGLKAWRDEELGLSSLSVISRYEVSE